MYKKLEIENDLHHFLEGLLNFNWEGADIQPQIRPRQIPVNRLNETQSAILKQI